MAKKNIFEKITDLFRVESPKNEIRQETTVIDKETLENWKRTALIIGAGLGLGYILEKE